MRTAEAARLRAVVNDLQARLGGGKDYLGPALCVCERREDGHVTGWRRDCDVHGDPVVAMPPGWISPGCEGCVAFEVRLKRIHAYAADQRRQADESSRLLNAAIDLIPPDAIGTPLRQQAEFVAAQRALQERHVERMEAENRHYRHGISDVLHRPEGAPEATGAQLLRDLPSIFPTLPANPVAGKPKSKRRREAHGQTGLLEAAADAG